MNAKRSWESNDPESRTSEAHISDTDLSRIMSEPEQILRSRPNPSFHTTLRWKGQKEQELDTLNDALRSEDEDPPSTPQHRTRSAPESFFQFLIHPRFRVEIRQIA